MHSTNFVKQLFYKSSPNRINKKKEKILKGQIEVIPLLLANC